MDREKYEKLGHDKNKMDREMDRLELRKIESRINAQSKFWTKIISSGTDHRNHHERILKSKQSNSQNSAPKYFLYKNPKVEGGFRPVVSGCSSDTLRLSNTLSEIVESICMRVENTYEVISSEYMLSRIHGCNENIKKLRTKNGDAWDWREHYMLLGSDVISLFPSLPAERTARAVGKT